MPDRDGEIEKAKGREIDRKREREKGNDSDRGRDRQAERWIDGEIKESKEEVKRRRLRQRGQREKERVTEM